MKPPEKSSRLVLLSQIVEQDILIVSQALRIKELEQELAECRQALESVCCGETIECLTCGQSKPCCCDK